MMWQNIFLVPYKKWLTYEMLSDNTDGYKCKLLVGQLDRSNFGCWVYNRNTKDLISETLVFYQLYIDFFQHTLPGLVDFTY